MCRRAKDNSCDKSFFRFLKATGTSDAAVVPAGVASGSNAAFGTGAGATSGVAAGAGAGAGSGSGSGSGAVSTAGSTAGRIAQKRARTELSDDEELSQRTDKQCRLDSEKDEGSDPHQE